MSHFRNISRLIGGIKPLRAPTHIFRNMTELVLVCLPGTLTAFTEQASETVAAQARSVAKATIVSVLELGPTLNVRRVGSDATQHTSIHAMQPSGIKDGFVQAGQNFTRDMGTVFAFISGDVKNIDLFDLPLMIMRPFTAPLADILNGMCNQIDGGRLQRYADKYR